MFKIQSRVFEGAFHKVSYPQLAVLTICVCFYFIYQSTYLHFNVASSLFLLSVSAAAARRRGSVVAAATGSRGLKCAASAAHGQQVRHVLESGSGSGGCGGCSGSGRGLLLMPLE